MTQLLQSAANEIITLRQKNQLMNARLQMFDDVMKILHTEPANQHQGAMHPDVLYELEKQIAANNTEAV